MGKIIDHQKAFLGALVDAIDGKIPELGGSAVKYGIVEDVACSLFSRSAYSGDGYPAAVPERMAMLVELDRFHRGDRETAISGWKSVVEAHNQELEAS